MKPISIFFLSFFCLFLIQCQDNFRSDVVRSKDVSNTNVSQQEEPESGSYKFDRLTSSDISNGSTDRGDVFLDAYDNSTITYTTTDACGNSSFCADVTNGLAASSGASAPVNQNNGGTSKAKKTLNVRQAEDDPNLKLIKTAYLTFEVDSIEKTRFVLESELKKLGGYISKEKESSSDYRSTVSMTVRLPKYYFNEMIFVCDAEGIKKFDQREIKTVDVSEEFVDLTARIKTKKELENRYHQLLKKAKDVEEVIRVEKEIEKLRSEIEAKEGRLKYLVDRVSLSTIHIDIYKVFPIVEEIVEVKEKPNQFAQAFLGGWNGLVGLFVGLVYIWPLLLVGTIVLFILNRYFRKYKTSKS